MTANQAMFPVSTMCPTLGVSRAGYYAWRERAPSDSSIVDAELTTRTEAIHQAPRALASRSVKALSATSSPKDLRSALEFKNLLLGESNSPIFVLAAFAIIRSPHCFGQHP